MNTSQSAESASVVVGRCREQYDTALTDWTLFSHVYLYVIFILTAGRRLKLNNVVRVLKYVELKYYIYAESKMAFSV